MDILLCGDFRPGELTAWRAALAAAMPEARWLDLAQAHQTAATVRAAVVAGPAPGQLQGLPQLGLVQSLWAGVDRVLADTTLPADVPLARMVDPMMSAAMAQTALWAVLALHRGFFAYAQRQRQGQWRTHVQQRASAVGVTVLGMGHMGRAVAQAIAQMGYRVQGWRSAALRHDAAPVDWPVHSGNEALRALLPHTDVLVNLLPLTPATRGLLDARLFAALAPHASVVNLARGAHVVDADLLQALAGGQLRHAVLDVFHQEPLPAGHAYWAHPQVTLLPHVAALTDVACAASVAAANLRALRDGAPLQHLVERRRGY